MPPKEIEIEMFPAGNGDAVLIHLGGYNIMLDSGYPSTYKKHMKTTLEKLQMTGEKINLMIISHVDADHISGAITFLQENGHSSDPQVISIDDIWHNSYRHFHFEEKISGTFQDDHKDLIPLRGKVHQDDADEDHSDVSFRQGTTLGATILQNAYPWNEFFNQDAVMVDAPIKHALSEQIAITLIGPTRSSLNTLKSKWLKALRKKYQGKLDEDALFDDAFELLMEWEEKPVFQSMGDVSGGLDWVTTYKSDWIKSMDEDTSVTNGSSISFLLEYEGKKLLFLADAIPSQVISQLEKMGYDETNPLVVDVLKVAHHGSFTNNDPVLFKIIKANHYLFSTNGRRHHHPHLETLAWAVDSNVASPKTLWFNYLQENLNIIENQVIKDRYNYEVKFPDIDGYQKITIPV